MAAVNMIAGTLAAPKAKSATAMMPAHRTMAVRRSMRSMTSDAASEPNVGPNIATPT